MLRLATLADEEISRIKTGMVEKPTDFQDYHWDGLFLRKNVGDEKGPHEWRVVVPIEARRMVMKFFHSRGPFAHMGRNKSCKLLARWFVWDGMYADMARHVAACAYCQAYKGGRISRESPLEHMFDNRFNSTVCVDLVDLGDEIEGFTMVDRATGLMVMGELPDQSSLTAVEVSSATEYATMDLQEGSALTGARSSLPRSG